MTTPTDLAGRVQPGILLDPPAFGRSLTFRLVPGAAPRDVTHALAAAWDATWGVVGLGMPLATALGATIAGLRPFPALAGPALAVPSTQQALWIFLRGDDRSTLVHRTHALTVALDGTCILDDALDTFLHDGGRDLTGYEDGTENPTGDDAVRAACASGGDGIAGSSFVAVQRWLHDLARFASFDATRRDRTIGRRLADNEEIADAPDSAHVKRAAQEDFDPPAFMVRRSHPWSAGTAEGLEFIAYGADLDRFERVLVHMTGADDGVVDALFSFSRPLTGGYYWCPPLHEGRLDLRAIAR